VDVGADVGVAMGDVWVLDVAVGAGEGLSVGSATVFVGSGLDCLQPAPQKIRTSANVTKMHRWNLLVIEFRCVKVFPFNANCPQPVCRRQN